MITFSVGPDVSELGLCISSKLIILISHNINVPQSRVPAAAAYIGYINAHMKTNRNLILQYIYCSQLVEPQFLLLNVEIQ